MSSPPACRRQNRKRADRRRSGGMTPAGEPPITVVVCTYNRSDLLKSCLDALVDQKTDAHSFEVVIVDNRSVDDTQEVIRKYTSGNPVFRAVIEMNQGISHARNRGFREARGEYVAYIDDDAIADGRWIAVMLDFIRRHPDAAAFGGPCYDYVDGGFPEWYPPEFRKFELDASGGPERPIQPPGEMFGGCNMVVRKELLRELGGFDTFVGHRGDKASYGEDTEMLMRIHLKGREIFYARDMKVKHFIPRHKLHMRQLLRSDYLKGRSIDHALHRKVGRLRHAFRLVGSFFLGVALFFKPASMPFKRRVYYGCRYWVYQTGAFVSAWEK